MKKNYSIILFLILGLSVNSQITLTNSTITPQIGDTFSYIVTPNYTFNVSQSGANQTWDFSTASGSTDVISFIALSGASDPSTFPLANLVTTSTNTNGETYLSASNFELATEGLLATGIAKAIYTDKQEYLKFPITYGDVFNETFSGTLENIAASQTFNRSGTIEILSDGHGDLILPYTTVNNVLRIKVTNTYSDVFMGIPVSSYSDVIHLWFNTATKSHLASTTEAYANGSLLTSQATYISQSDLVLDVTQSNLLENQISFYPNPTSNYIIVKNTSYKTPLKIYDSRGLLVRTINIEKGKTQVDISSLPSGIYLIKYTKDLQSFTKKLIVK